MTAFKAIKPSWAPALRHSTVSVHVRKQTCLRPGGLTTFASKPPHFCRCTPTIVASLTKTRSECKIWIMEEMPFQVFFLFRMSFNTPSECIWPREDQKYEDEDQWGAPGWCLIFGRVFTWLSPSVVLWRYLLTFLIKRKSTVYCFHNSLVSLVRVT